MRRKLLFLALSGICFQAFSQTDAGRIVRDMDLELETTTTVSGGNYTPLWLSSNRYGLSSTHKTWNYERVALHRDIQNDAQRNWRFGWGADQIILGIPFYGEPGSICSQTYICIGYDAKKHNFSKEQCLNIISYIKTRFFRYMVSLRKRTQDAFSQVYEFVPMQDFSEPWTDEKLYAKYGITPDEQAYIESLIKPME